MNHSYWSVVRAFWYFLDTDRLKFLVWNILVFIVHFAELVTPILIGLIADFFMTYQAGDSLRTFYVYAVVVASLYIVAAVIRLNAKKILAKIGIRLVYDVRVKGYARLLEFPISWHQQESSGNRIERINEGSKAMSQWTHLLANDLYSILSILIGVIIIFIYLDWTLLVFFASYIFLFALNEYFFNKVLSRKTLERNKLREQASGTFYEGTSNITTIKTLGAKQSMAQKVTDVETKTKDMNYRITNTGINKWISFQVLNGVALLVFLYLIGLSVIGQKITPAFIVVYFTYFVQLRKATGNISKLTNTLIELKTSVVRMMPIFLDQPIEHFGSKSFPQNWKSIILDKVTFSYKQEGHSKTISDLNVEIRKGEKIGVVGESGSGKSTLVKLFAGLYKIDSGSIHIDGINFYDINHDELLTNISFVLQETELFNMSLKDNVTMLSIVDESTLQEVIHSSRLQSVIDSLPAGLDTLIGEKGYRLSGGERQRVGIARALCQNKSVMIFDEATSSLDSTTEKLIQESLEKHYADHTMIIVAHRLSTLRNVDRIIVFDKGCVVEEGSFDELLKRKGVFARLAHKKK